MAPHCGAIFYAGVSWFVPDDGRDMALVPASNPATQHHQRAMWPVQIDLWVAAGVVLATATTDAVYVMFTSAVIARRRVPAATWSSIWYLLSSFAVISYTNNWVYVLFAAGGSWIGAYISITLLHRSPTHAPPPPPLGPAPS
jgi:hypothetical protein